MERLIFHCDCNNFFASCECLERPELKLVPMAVAGDPQARRGIVVAKNELAKKAGVKTTDTIWQARQKCPGIVFVPPRHGFYKEISRRVNAIYREYTEYVEPASIDESYLDLSGTLGYYGMSAVELADELRRRVREEIGVTISVGVSFNKVFAKMGSDYKKPDATTLITPGNYKEVLWPLPASDMLFAGRATVEALGRLMIFTVGDLARADEGLLRSHLGRSGAFLHRAANGFDDAPVRLFTDREAAKSVSHGMTFPHDLTSLEEVKSSISRLSEEVASQLKRKGMKGSVVFLSIKTPELRSFSRQTTLRRRTDLAREIAEAAAGLIESAWRVGPDDPVRALTVGVTHLESAEAAEQLSFFDLSPEGEKSRRQREKQEKLERAVEELRRKHGKGSVSRGLHRDEKT